MPTKNETAGPGRTWKLIAGIVGLAAIGSGAGQKQGSERWIFLGVGLVAAIAVTSLITRRARRALKAETEEVRSQLDEKGESNEK